MVLEDGMKLKLVVHVNEPERWPVAISSITNFLNDAGDENADVVVVVNGAGVRGLVDGAPKTGIQGEACAIMAGASIPEMERLSTRGVTFLACHNALRSQNIDPEDLPSFVRVVAAGMTEMVRLQMDGYAYVKP